jgi:hypothetical protein
MGHFRFALLACALLPIAAVAQEEPGKEEGRYKVGYKGYTHTPLIPGQKWKVHSPDRPTPKAVHPGKPTTETKAGAAPSDAIVLFGGKNTSAFKKNAWKVIDGELEAGKGNLVTNQPFGDCQIHAEWRTPSPPRGGAGNRGNSGFYIMTKYELQVYDSFSSKIYADGSAGAVYGQSPPLVNATRKPGEWQVFDVIFTAPVFDGATLKSPARITAIHNGVLVQNNTEILGPTQHQRAPRYGPHAAKLPLLIQGHGSPVRYRNIWIRELNQKP